MFVQMFLHASGYLDTLPDSCYPAKSSAVPTEMQAHRCAPARARAMPITLYTHVSGALQHETSFLHRTPSKHTSKKRHLSPEAPTLYQKP
jgi:hypothetical protein